VEAAAQEGQQGCLTACFKLWWGALRKKFKRLYLRIYRETGPVLLRFFSTLTRGDFEGNWIIFALCRVLAPVPCRMAASGRTDRPPRADRYRLRPRTSGFKAAIASSSSLRSFLNSAKTRSMFNAPPGESVHAYHGIHASKQTFRFCSAFGTSLLTSLSWSTSICEHRTLTSSTSFS